MEQQNQNNLSNSSFKYVSGSDVQSVWRKYGWTPPTEYRNDYAFKHNREALELNE